LKDESFIRVLTPVAGVSQCNALLNILLGQLFHNSSKPLRRITYDVSSSEEEGVSSEEKIICSVIDLYRFLVYKIPTATKRILMRLIPSTSTRNTVNRRTLGPVQSAKPCSGPSFFTFNLHHKSCNLLNLERVLHTFGLWLGILPRLDLWYQSCSRCFTPCSYLCT
jgi:hypothetical protein